MKSLLKTLLVLASVSLVGGGLAACSAMTPRQEASNGYRVQKVVYHFNNAQKADAGLHNIMNHLNAVGEKNTRIVVVTHGKGIDFLLDGWKDKNGKSYDGLVQELANRGVEFDVCANTLKGRKIDKNKVNLIAKIVPSGVATVAELQQEGYAYVKP